MRGLVTAVAFLCCAVAAGANAGSFEENADFGSNPGQLRMFQYIPRGLQPNRPLVVVLHGCTQDGVAYANQTGWRTLADKLGFALLLPQQRMSNNIMKCFNWFEPDDIRRDQGESLSIKNMIDKMKADFQIDSSRIYITGLSAGGAMTAVMLATYPEQFAAGAVIAGMPYNCAGGVDEARACMDPGKNLSPAEWGDRVRGATDHDGPWPKISIWHGDQDTIVKPLNATELVDQWTNLHCVDQQPDVEDTVDGHPHKVYQDAGGRGVVETYLIRGMKHGAPIDPGDGDSQCGSAGPFILDADICSTHRIARFWGLDDSKPEPPPASDIGGIR
jgi:poly(hydroxyalkanoate) depolymerase family esterase